MSLLDILVLIPLVWFTYKGFTKGFIIELASLVALVLGIYLAYFFSDITASFLLNKLGFNSKYIQPISFVLTFLIVVILIFIMAKALETLIKTASLGVVNKLFGAVFGGAKMALICGFCLYQLSFFDTDNKFISSETKEKSYTYKPLINLSVSVIPLIKNIKQKITDNFNQQTNKTPDD